MERKILDIKITVMVPCIERRERYFSICPHLKSMWSGLGKNGRQKGIIES